MNNEAYVTGFFEGLKPNDKGVAVFSYDAYTPPVLSFPREIKFDLNLSVFLCIIIPQPRSMFAWQPTHKLTLVDVANRWPRVNGSLPDDINLRITGMHIDEPLDSSCILLSSLDGVRVPSWVDNSTMLIPNVRWKDDGGEYPNGPLWGYASEGFLPSDNSTVNVLSPTHATVYKCSLHHHNLLTVTRREATYISTLSEAPDIIRMNISVRIDHTAFSWHSQAKSKWPVESGFDELDGAPNAILALHTPHVLHKLKIEFPYSLLGGVIPYRPLCERADEPGAWVKVPDAGTLGPSADGRWWRAHSCVYSAAIHTPKCIGPRFGGARIFGDSHMRRAWKDLKGLAPPFVSEGAAESSWCTGRHKSRVCVCEDGHEGGLFDEGNLGFNSFGGGDHPVISWSWGGSGFDTPDHRAETSTVLLSGSSELRPGIVIFDLVHWDAAFSTFFRFLKSLKALSKRSACFSTFLLFLLIPQIRKLLV